MDNHSLLKKIWGRLYPGINPDLLDEYLDRIRPMIPQSIEKGQSDWYKDAVVYSLYIDLFNKDINGLIDKLDYLKDLGISCLWLLPILESPMRDAGFDIADYYSVRKELAGPGEDRAGSFRELLRQAHQRGIRVIFDVAMNHTSDQHPWFLESRKSEDNPYRNYYIWTKDTTLFSSARIIFKGIEQSNWERCGDAWYFHRFFSFQPDLNYRNPEVLLAMCDVLLFWQREGVDGFRMDAVPYIWKDEGTDCENLPQTHLVAKFIRAMLDHCKPGTLMLAEACQPPMKVVEYLGEGDECHAAYHFPLMPRIFMALARENGLAVRQTLSEAYTPSIPANAQWFIFLRCHDELSLERVYVTEEERAFIHQQYCHDPLWDFRVGEGISARLAELLLRNPDKILSAFSIMLSLPGTPVIYYGDETAKLNDKAYYHEMIFKTGKDDTRFLVRGRIDWQEHDHILKDKASTGYKVFHGLKKMTEVRKLYPVFGRGSVDFVDLHCDNPGNILSFIREYEGTSFLIIHNLGKETLSFIPDSTFTDSVDLISGTTNTRLNPYSFQWRIKNC